MGARAVWCGVAMAWWVWLGCPFEASAQRAHLSVMQGGAVSDEVGTYGGAEASLPLVFKGDADRLLARRWSDCRESLALMIAPSCLGGGFTGLHLSGAAEYLRVGERREVRYEERVTLGLGFLELEQFASHQREGRFSDWFWRSRDGLIEQGGGIRVPGIWYAASSEREVRVASVGVRGSRVARDDLKGDVATQVSLTTYLFEVDWSDAQEQTTSLKAMGLIWHHAPLSGPEEGVTVQGDETEERSLRIQKFDFRGVELSNFALTERLRLDWSVGWSLLMPVHVRVATTTEGAGQGGEPKQDVRYEGDWAHAPTVRMGVLYRTGDSAHVRLVTGTFDRLDPSGYAVDYGGYSGLRVAALPTSWLAFQLDGQLALARRALVSPYAEPHGVSIAPEGTLMKLWRAEASMRLLPIRGSLSLQLRGWVDVTDRDDPLWQPGGTRIASPRQIWGGDAVVQLMVF